MAACALNKSHTAAFCCTCTRPSLKLCSLCIGDHLLSRGNHNIRPLNFDPEEAAEPQNSPLEELRGMVALCKEVMQTRFRELEEDFKAQLEEFTKIEEALKVEEAGRGVGLVEKPSEMRALLDAYLKSGRVHEVFQFDASHRQPGLSEALGVTWSTMVHPSPPQPSQFLVYSKDATVEALVATLQRHRIPLQLIDTFRNQVQALLQTPQLEEEMANFCRNFQIYLHVPPSDETLEALAALIPQLRTLLNPENLVEWKSLGHILTRKHTLPAEIVSLSHVSMCLQNSLLAEVRKDHLRVFDCVQEQWRAKVALRAPINVTNWSASAFLGNGFIFICGGHEPDYLADTYELNPATGAVVNLEDMLEGNSCHSLQPYFSWVYSFGGFTGTTVPRAEKYSLASNTWTPLPNMLTPRRCFTPCLYNHIIYICGGADTNLSETFNPVTESYTMLSFLLPESYDTRATVLGEELVTIGERYVTRVNLRNNSQPRAVKHPACRAYGVMCPVILGTRVWYNVWEDSSIVCFEVNTAVPEIQINYKGQRIA